VLPQTFIRDCQLVFETKQQAGLPYNDKEKILFAVTNTGGRARNWAAAWHASTDAHTATWSNFRAAFLQQFVPFDDDVSALNKLHQLKINNDFQSLEVGLRDFTARFNELVLRVPHLPKDSISLLYTVNLPYALQKEVHQQTQQWRGQQLLLPGQSAEQLQPSLMQLQEWAHAACGRVQPSWALSRKPQARFGGKSDGRFKRPHYATNALETDDYHGGSDQNRHDTAHSLGVNANQTSYRQQGRAPPAQRPQLSDAELQYCRSNMLRFNCKQSLKDGHKRRGGCQRQWQPIPADAKYQRLN
jgi:hypothetical protein